MNPVENIWQYLRAKKLSNRILETDDAIVDAACEASNWLMDRSQTITSVGLRDWAHSGQT